jgi:hypothetical protein
MISHSSFNLNIFLRLVFSNSENCCALKTVLLLLIKILRTLSVLSKAKLETLEAVEDKM